MNRSPVRSSAGKPSRTAQLAAAHRPYHLLRVVEDLTASEIRRRYLRDRSDGLDVPDFARLCCTEC